MRECSRCQAPSWRRPAELKQLLGLQLGLSRLTGCHTSTYGHSRSICSGWMSTDIHRLAVLRGRLPIDMGLTSTCMGVCRLTSTSGQLISIRIRFCLRPRRLTSARRQLTSVLCELPSALGQLTPGVRELAAMRRRPDLTCCELTSARCRRSPGRLPVPPPPCAIQEASLLGTQITMRNNWRLQAAMRSSRLPASKTLAHGERGLPGSAESGQDTPAPGVHPDSLS